MGTFTGTAANETITPRFVSGTVTRNPAGSFPYDGADILYGMGGNDTLSGGEGNDRIYGGDGNDYITGDYGYEGEYNDWLDGGAGNDVIWGSGGDDVIYGGDGNDRIGGLNTDDMEPSLGSDTLYGGAGNDELYMDEAMSSGRGGVGNDTYWVNNPGGKVIEVSGEGTDSVFLAGWFVSPGDPGGLGVYTMPSNVENLSAEYATYHGEPLRINGTGNALNKIITGNDEVNVLSGLAGNDTLKGLGGNDNLYGGDGNDILDGGTGADRMLGGTGTGNDTFYVDNVGDQVVEYTNQGTDTVFSSITHTLAANVENLTLTGTGAINGTGNALANVIFGKSGANVLTGLDGNDTLNGLDGSDKVYGGNGNDRIIGGWGTDQLTGGAGSDRFEFGAAINSPKGAGDRITDFNLGNDTIVIDLPSGKGAYIGSKVFSAGGMIEARYDAALDMVQVDLNNSGSFNTGDLEIRGITAAPTASDFLFV